MREINFSNVSPDADEVIWASVIAVGLLDGSQHSAGHSGEARTDPMSRQAETIKTGSSATFVVAIAYHPKRGRSTSGVTTMRLTTATITVRVSPGGGGFLGVRGTSGLAESIFLNRFIRAKREGEDGSGEGR